MSNQDDVKAMRERAATARRAGDLLQAAKCLGRAAGMLDVVGHHDEALAELDDATALARDAFDLALLTELLGFRAWILQGQERYEPALVALREMESIDRELGSDKLEITLEQQFSVLWDSEGDVAELRRVAEAFFEVAKDGEAILRIRRRLARLGVEIGAEAAVAHPHDLTETTMDRVSQIDHDKARAGELAAHAVELMQQGRLAEALELTWQALQLSPDDAQLWWLRGHAFSYLRQYEDEIACCDRALALKPDYVEALSMKAAALLSLERYPEAVECCIKALRIRDDVSSVHMNMGAALMGMKVYDVATKAFLKAAELGDPRGDQAAASCAQLAQGGSGS